MNNLKEMQSKPIRSTLILSVPIIILLASDAFYHIADIFWISGLGTSAIVSIGYISNFLYIIDKIGDGIGRSVSVLISNSLGAEEYEKSHEFAKQGLIIILIISLIIPFITVPFIKTVCVMTGIGQFSSIIYSYMTPMLTFGTIIMLNDYLSAILSSEADTKRASMIIIVGNIVNLILDPILIYTFHLGMLGAAVATLIGFSVSLILFCHLFWIKKDTVVKLDLKNFKFNIKIIKEIIVLAVPIILDGIILSTVGMVIMYGLHLYASPIAVCAYVIMLNIQSTSFTPLQGITKGFCIVTSHLAGAGKFTILSKAIRQMFMIGILISIIISLVLIFFSTPLTSIFTSDLIVANEIRNMLGFIVIYILTFPITLGCTYVFLGLKKSFYTLIFLILNFILLGIFILIFSHFLNFKGYGVYLSIALTNIIEAVAMIILLKTIMKRRIYEFEAI